MKVRYLEIEVDDAIDPSERDRSRVSVAALASTFEQLHEKIFAADKDASDAVARMACRKLLMDWAIAICASAT